MTERFAFSERLSLICSSACNANTNIVATGYRLPRPARRAKTKRWTRTDCVSEAMLKNARYLAFFEGFDHVAGLEVLEVGQADTAFKAFTDFASIFLEPLE
jgi:hypothetical protein